MFKSLGKRAKRQDFGPCTGFFGCRAIRKNAGELRDLCDPTAVVFDLGFNAQMHGSHHSTKCVMYAPELLAPVRLSIQFPEVPAPLQPGEQSERGQGHHRGGDEE